MSWEEIERSLDKNTELLELLSYFRLDLGLHPEDLAKWLIPELRDLPPMLDRCFHDWLGKQRFRSERSDHASITDMFRLMTKLVRENEVSGEASPYVIKCTEDSIGPYFNQDPIACIALLRSLKAECTSPLVSNILNDLVKHYEQVLEFGGEIERDLRESSRS